MAAHYDFRLMLAVKLSRLLNKFIDPVDISVGVPSTPTFSTPRNTMIAVTVDSRTIYVTYDRTSYSKYLVGISTARQQLKLTSDDPVEIVSLFNLKFGTEFTVDEFESVLIDEINYVVTFKFKPTHTAYIGSFSVKMIIKKAGAIVFDNNWPLYEDSNDRGSMAKPLGGTWSRPNITGTLWGQLGDNRTPLMFPAGCEMPLFGDFIYDFEFVMTSISTYHCILGVDPAGDGYTKSTGCIYFYNGRIYIYQVTSQFGPTMVANVPMRWTFYGTNGQLKIYADGVLVNTIAQPNATWVCFRNSDSGATLLGQNSAIRNFKVMRRAPNEEELAAILAGNAFKPDIPQPLHAVALRANDYSNEGTNVTTLNEAIPNLLYNNKTFFGFQSAGSIVPLGITLPMSGDFTVDFELAIQSPGVSNAVFKSYADNTTNTNGDLKIGADDKPYLHGVNQAPIYTKAINGGATRRYTIIRTSNIVRWYEDGILLPTGNQTSVGYSITWRYIYPGRPLTLFRNLRYWTYAITAAQLTALLSYK